MTYVRAEKTIKIIPVRTYARKSPLRVGQSDQASDDLWLRPKHAFIVELSKDGIRVASVLHRNLERSHVERRFLTKQICARALR